MEKRAEETVERAAVLQNGVVYDVPRPGRHDAAIRLAVEKVGREVFSDDPHEQGFTTSTGRFVTRHEAARIALAAGQITSLAALRCKTLTSEDLWCGCGAPTGVPSCCGPGRQ